MRYFLITSGVGDMWLFGRGKPSQTEARVQDIHQDTFAKIDRATESIDKATASIDKLNRLLEEKGDTAYNIFVATGGPRRNKK